MGKKIRVSCGDVRAFVSKLEVAVEAIRNVIDQDLGFFADSSFDRVRFIGSLFESLISSRFGVTVLTKYGESDAVVLVKCYEGVGESSVRVDVVESVDGILSIRVK
jgi:hypothetical protein